MKEGEIPSIVASDAPLAVEAPDRKPSSKRQDSKPATEPKHKPGVSEDAPASKDQPTKVDIPSLKASEAPVAAKAPDAKPKSPFAVQKTKEKQPGSEEMKIQLVNLVEKMDNLDQETKDLLAIQIATLTDLTEDSVTMVTTKKDGTPVNLTINCADKRRPLSAEVSVGEPGKKPKTVVEQDVTVAGKKPVLVVDAPEAKFDKGVPCVLPCEAPVAAEAPTSGDKKHTPESIPSPEVPLTPEMKRQIIDIVKKSPLD